MPTRLVLTLLLCLAATSACSPPAGPASIGSAELTAGGTPLGDGTSDVPATLDLKLVVGRSLSPGEVQVQVDSRALAPAVAGRSASVRVPALALGSSHRLSLAAPGYARALTFTVIGPTGAMAAVHREAGTVVADIVFEHDLAAPGQAALAPAASVAWRDKRHARITWPLGAQPAAVDIDPGLAVDRGSRLAGPLHLALAPLPPAGSVRRVTMPAVAAPASTAVIAYSVSTSSSRAAAAAHGGQLSVISPTGWVVSATGLSGAPDAGSVAAGRAAGRPVWPLVQNDWNDGPAFGASLADPAARTLLAASIASAVKAAGFPGIHLDLEALAPESRADLTSFIEAVARALHSNGAHLAVDVVPHRPNHLSRVAAPYDLPAIGAAADALIFMAYDQHVAAGDSGPVASLEWDRQLLDGSLGGIDPHKVWLGLPLYSRTWSGPDVNADSYAYSVSHALAGAPASVDYDFAGATPFIVWGADQHAATYFDDADSLARKIGLAHQRGLAGVALWRLGFEDPAFWRILP